MTLLEILNQVLTQSGFLERDLFFGSSDIDDKQMIALANRAQIEVRDYYPWGSLVRTREITLLDGIDTYALPSDFQSMVPDSIWQENGSRQAEFPVPDNRWYMYRFSAFSDGGTYRIKKVGDNLIINEPKAGDTLEFAYLSNSLVRAASGASKELFSADTDTWDLDDQLLILAIQAHWSQTKLLPQATDWYANYMAKMREAIGRDAGGRIAGGASRGSFINDRRPYTPLWVR